jgi:hypothetical protein
VLFAQAKQHYNLGNLRDADAVAASIVELGQLIGTKEQVIEATFMRVFIALMRGEWRSPSVGSAWLPMLSVRVTRPCIRASSFAKGG